MPVKKQTAKKAKPRVVKKIPDIPTSARIIISEHLAETIAALSGLVVVICATIAATVGVLDSNALSVILGGAVGVAGGYGAGKAAR